MTSIETRLSRIEAVQFFELAVIGALTKACSELPGFKEYARENLERSYALLLAESVDEVKLRAYEELKDELLRDRPI